MPLRLCPNVKIQKHTINRCRIAGTVLLIYLLFTSVIIYYCRCAFHVWMKVRRFTREIFI